MKEKLQLIVTVLVLLAGVWTESFAKAMTPFTYEKCTFDESYPESLNEVRLTYDAVSILTEGIAVQLWEGEGCETLVAETFPWYDWRVNCYVIIAEFGGITLSPEKHYTLVLPEGLLTNQDVPSVRSEIPVGLISGVKSVADSSNESVLPVYDMQGRIVRDPVPGHLYIRAGRKYIPLH